MKIASVLNHLQLHLYKATMFVSVLLDNNKQLMHKIEYRYIGFICKFKVYASKIGNIKEKPHKNSYTNFRVSKLSN